MSSKALSLKLREDIFKETENIVKAARTSRNAYINNAVDFYNQLQKRSMLKKKLHWESKMVAAESMKVLEELEAFTEND